MPDDQIYERYQARAIAETNQLGHEIATWVGDHHPAQAPVIGTGHPLADIFLLKYRPTAAEVQEGVAFFGRAGQAVLKSIERLRIDPLKLYGSVCLKVDIDPGPDDLAQARAWLTNELHITQPGIVVAMGSDAVAFLGSLEFPLSSPVESGLGNVQPFTPTIDLLAVPDIDSSLNDSAAKREFWAAFKALGEWYDNLPPY
ncbi:MAG TPA: uracil-DNA glycosylase family protein [Gaiellales bacterium]|nr:uracil-DNA glycosylase family protein [Gaiellales bacterium]